MILDHETRAGGLIQSFNVQGIFVAPGFPIKNVTLTDVGTMHLITLSGLIGNDSAGKLVGVDMYSQTLQTLKNVQTAIIATAEYLGIIIDKSQALSYITFSRVDLIDLTQATELNRAYIDARMAFTPRAAIEVKKLPLSGLVEITATAVLPKLV